MGGIVAISTIVLCTLIFFLWNTVYKHDKQQGDTSHVGLSQGSVSATNSPQIPTSAYDEAKLSHATSSESTFITIIDSCTYNYTGECVRVRSGPGLNFPVVTKLRNDMVLMVDPKKQVAADGHLWHKVLFDEHLQYPERITSDWYVADEYVKTFLDIGIITENSSPATTKRIVIDRSEQTLSAYDGEMVVMSFPISTGLLLTPTPRGTFTIFRKTPTRYMQGPLKNVSSQYYDLPGVPWNLYFTEDGAVIHGAYWHNSFGHQYSHGCINLLPADAQKLYTWATLGMKVTVQD